MGAWGTAIDSHDTFADVTAAVTRRLKTGAGLSEACAVVLQEFAEVLADDDDGASVWHALAHLQWKYAGTVQAEVLEKIRRDFYEGRGLDGWSAEDLERRRSAVSRFLAKVEAPNLTPTRLPTIRRRPAPFSTGDCLSFETACGLYGAAIVLATDNSEPEYGLNLVGCLNYLEANPPAHDTFEARDWLRLFHGSWKGQQELVWRSPTGFRQQRDKISRVATTLLRPDDPTESNRYSGWAGLGVQILICRGLKSQHPARRAEP